MAQTNWIITYTVNGREHTETYEFRLIAEIKMIQLQAYGIKPTITGNINANARNS